MGNCFENEKTPEELDYESNQIKYGQQFRALRLKDHEVKQLHEVFWYLDRDHIQWLDIQEIYNYVGMKPTKYSDFIFNHYNDEKTYGFIPFRDFVVVLWNYCSLSPSPLGKMNFPEVPHLIMKWILYFHNTIKMVVVILILMKQKN